MKTQKYNSIGSMGIPFLPEKVEIKTRNDLSFTGRQEEAGRLFNWMPPRLPKQVDQWDKEYAMGFALGEEIMELAKFNEKEAFDAIRFAIDSPEFKGGFGAESGFISFIAAMAVKGINASSLETGSRLKVA